MFFKRRQDSQITLHTPGIVIANVISNHLNQFLFAGEAFAIVALSLQDAPKAFHGAVVNAVCHPGHALRHASLFNFVVESTTCILKSSIAVKQRMCVEIFLNSLIKGLEHEQVVVAFTCYERYNAPVTEV